MNKMINMNNKESKKQKSLINKHKKTNSSVCDQKESHM